MGTSHSANELAVKILDGSAAIAGASKDGVAAAAQASKTTILATAAPDTGGDLKLSRWGRKGGVKLNVGYDVDSTGPGTATATLEPRPLGVWRTLNDGARPHAIIPGLTRRQTQAAVLFTFMGGGRGEIEPAALAAIERGNRNNKNSRRRRKRTTVLKIGGNYRAFANHPGTEGKGTWDKGAEAAKPVAVSVYRTEHRRALIGAFR